MSLKGIKVTAGHILLKPIKQGETKTSSGIIIPETVTNVENKGEVVITGKPLPGSLMEVKPGDIVNFNKSMGERFKIGDEEVILIRHSDIRYYIPK